MFRSMDKLDGYKTKSMVKIDGQLDVIDSINFYTDVSSQ